jgi:hypothetical protein
MDREVLDDRVGQQGVSDRFERLVIDAIVDLELEVLALPDAADTGNAEPAERAQDRLTLRVENLGLEYDVDNDTGHSHSVSARADAITDISSVGRHRGTDPQCGLRRYGR